MQKSYRRWYYSHGLMIYLDENAKVERALYLDDDDGGFMELFPESLELVGMGYQNSSNQYTIECFFRNNSNYRKHILVSRNENLIYNVEEQRLEKWI